MPNYNNTTPAAALAAENESLRARLTAAETDTQEEAQP